MSNLLKTRLRIVGSLFAAGLLAGAHAATIARPGVVNYAEGQVSVNGRAVNARSLGSAEVGAGQVLRTDRGRAELLLTPGVFLRLDNDSAVRMVSPSITDTRVEVLRGRALVEVAQIEKENRLDIIDNGAVTQLKKRGLYRFNADNPRVAVLDGKATVIQDDRAVDVSKGKELPLEPRATNLKPEKFDKNAPDELYSWSKLRSEYLARANASSARTILAYGPSWYTGTGWYWNPYFDTFAFVPGAGYLYSPFGYGFYSPAYLYTYYPSYGYYGPGRVWRGGGGHRNDGGAGTVTRPAAPVGGSGVQFGAPAAPRMSSPAPSSAPATRAPAMGGGVRLGR